MKKHNEGVEPEMNLEIKLEQSPGHDRKHTKIKLMPDPDLTEF